jgi:hypothetical protein
MGDLVLTGFIMTTGGAVVVGRLFVGLGADNDKGFIVKRE